MAFTAKDWALTGVSPIYGLDKYQQNQTNKQRDRAIQMANELYNPAQFNPQLDEARTRAYEGIDDANIRAGVTSRIFANEPQNTAAAYGGNATAMVAGLQQSDVARSAALGQAEMGIALQEEEAKRLGRMSMAEILTQQNQMAAQRGASIKGAQMQADAAILQGRMGMIKTGLDIGLAAMTMGTSAAAAPIVAGATTAATQAVPGTTPSAAAPTTPAVAQVAPSASNLVVPKVKTPGLQVPEIKATELPPQSTIQQQALKQFDGNNIAALLKSRNISPKHAPLVLKEWREAGRPGTLDEFVLNWRAAK